MAALFVKLVTIQKVTDEAKINMKKNVSTAIIARRRSFHFYNNDELNLLSVPLIDIYIFYNKMRNFSTVVEPEHHQLTCRYF